MTRMIAKAYRVADSIRAAGIPVVMGGPHVTEVPEEALGRNGEERHADALALGEADETWPLIVEDAARGELKEIYTSTDASGRIASRRCGITRRFPGIHLTCGSSIEFRVLCVRHAGLRGSVGDISHHSHRVRARLSLWMRVLHSHRVFRRLDPVPLQSEHRRGDAQAQRACPQQPRQIAVFFVDDNFAINVKRTKALLRDIIAAGAVLSWGRSNQRQPAAR